MNLALVLPGVMLLAAINGYRADNGLQALTYSNDTCNLAVERLQDLPKDWSHNGFFFRLKSEKLYGVWHENLARDYGNWHDVLEAWKKSPVHNANLLAKDAKEGCVVSNGVYWVFESKLPVKLALK